MIFPAPVLFFAWMLASAQTPTPQWLDSARVRQVLSATSADSAMPFTSDWTLVGPVGDSGVLLADGAEWFRLSPTQMLALKHPDPGRTGTGWSNLRPGYDRVLDWGTLPSGIRVGAMMSNGRGGYSSSLLDWRTGVQYRHSFSRYIAVAGELAWEQTLFAVETSDLLGDSAKPSGLGMMLGVCGPFVCFEMQRHALPVTSESWLQDHLDSLVRGRHRGTFWTMAGDSGFSSAWERRLAVRIGVFGYAARWCPGLWDGPLQSIGLWDMPAGFLQFGAGVEWTRHRAATRGEIAIAPIAWKVRSPGSDGLALELSPMSLSIAYRKMGEFQMSIQSSLRFSDPFTPFASRTASR